MEFKHILIKSLSLIILAISFTSCDDKDKAKILTELSKEAHRLEEKVYDDVNDKLTKTIDKGYNNASDKLNKTIDEVKDTVKNTWDAASILSSTIPDDADVKFVEIDGVKKKLDTINTAFDFLIALDNVSFKADSVGECEKLVGYIRTRFHEHPRYNDMSESYIENLLVNQKEKCIELRKEFYSGFFALSSKSISLIPMYQGIPLK